MVQGLVRHQRAGYLQFVTFSCDRRRANLGSAEARDMFVRASEAVHVRYAFEVRGYVGMPEHVHLLVSESREVFLAKALQALKLSVAVKREERPFWQARHYDFNVFSEEKWLEKLK